MSTFEVLEKFDLIKPDNSFLATVVYNILDKEKRNNIESIDLMINFLNYHKQDLKKGI